MTDELDQQCWQHWKSELHNGGPVIEKEQMEQKLTNSKAWNMILHKSGPMVSALINSAHNVT